MQSESKPASASSKIRADYMRKTTWTICEAMDYCGLRRTQLWTLQKKMEHLNKRKAWKQGMAFGPYRIDAQSFMEFMRTGNPQGEKL